VKIVKQTGKQIKKQKSKKETCEMIYILTCRWEGKGPNMLR